MLSIQFLITALKCMSRFSGVRDNIFKVPVRYRNVNLIFHKAIRILGLPGNHVRSELGKDYIEKHSPWGRLENTYPYFI